MEVAQSGQFEVAVDYCHCQFREKLDVGVELTLSAGTASLTALVNEFHERTRWRGRGQDVSDGIVYQGLPAHQPWTDLSELRAVKSQAEDHSHAGQAMDFSSLILKKVAN